MLRPATPLTILLLASFVLLLLSVLSTPIIRGVPIANFKEVSFGVFGYCSPTECSGPRIGYDTDGLFGPDDGEPDFSLPSAARHSLSALLVVHPIAALFNLVCLGLAGAAHLHSPSHSARYLLALLILLLPTLLVTLLAFLVDILLFVPHLQWGGWIVLASTILITASGVVTCAMRRTLVSRKARKKRIAENAEMSGENFYSRQNSQQPKTDTGSTGTSVEPKSPMVHGAPGANALPAFAVFSKEQDTSEARSEVSGRTPSEGMDDRSMGCRGSNGEALGPVRSRSQDQYWGPRDKFGNPILSPNHPAAGPPILHRDPSDPNLRQRMSREHMNGLPAGHRGGFVHGGPRGRGGCPRGSYGPPRGGFGGPRGGPNQGYGRGRYNDGRGGYYNGQGRGGVMAAGVGAGIAAGTLMGRSQAGPPPGYPPNGQRVSPEEYGSGQESHRAPTQGYIGTSDIPRQPSPGGQMRRQSSGLTPPSPPGGPFVGQAVEMNASTGRISQAAARSQEEEVVHNVISLQPNQSRELLNQPSPSSEYSSPGEPRPPNMAQPPDMVSPSSMYSHAPDGYIPPRAAWTSNSRIQSPMRDQIQPDPADLSSGPIESRRHASSHYYEDVDPRFSEVYVDPSPPTDHSTLPTSLTPGPAAAIAARHPAAPTRRIPPNFSDENLQDGARSPTGSEVSHYTSVSQRGVNPRWRPGSEDLRSMPPPSSMRKPVPGPGMGPSRDRDPDVLLQRNPDFEIPGTRPPGRGAGPSNGGGRIPPPVQQPGANMNTQVSSGLEGTGRYPQP